MPAERTSATRQLKRGKKFRETDIANEKMGRNSLQGDDQSSVRNERHDQPETRRDPDEIMESFEKMDKDKRARTDLGKGNRSGE